MKHSFYLTLIATSALLFYPARAFSQGSGFTKSNLEWQNECVKKSTYTTQARREALKRFGVSIEVPAGMDFVIERTGSEESVEISEVEGIALTRCIQIAKKLHGIDLPGRGISTITIAEGRRLVNAQSDEFVDAVILLGEKTPVYTDGIEAWSSFRNHKTGRWIQVSAFEVGGDFFIRFLRLFQPY